MSVAGSAFARDIRFEVTLDRNKVSIGSTANLSLAFFGTQDISRPDLPDIHGFDWKYIGPSLRMSIVNGRASSSITHNYILIPLKVGEFSIPPFSVFYNGKTYSSDPIPIEVASGPVSPPTPTQKESYGTTVQDLGDRIFITMSAGKRRAYINESVPVTIKLYINRLGIKDIHYPNFEHDGFSAEKFEEPRQYKEIVRGVPYDVVEFTTFVSGLRQGELKLGPARLKFDLLLKRKTRPWRSSPFDDDKFFGPSAFDSFFGGYEKYPLDLKSEEALVTVMELPTENVPEDFNGAIGSYKFFLEASPLELKAGDPITLKMTVTGEGNFNTVKVPKIKTNGDFKSYDPDVKQDQTGKVFEQVIIPTSDRVKEIPEITFSYFDTSFGEYRTIRRPPVPIKVEALQRGEELRIFDTPGKVTRALRERETLGRDIRYIKEDPGILKVRGSYLSRNRLFVGFQLIPLLVLIITFFRERRRERLEKDVSYARRMRAPGKARKNIAALRRMVGAGDAVKFYDAVFVTLKEYLGGKFRLASAGITPDVVDALEGRGIDRETLLGLSTCFKSCDAARYATASVTRVDMEGTLKLLEKTIDALERIRS